MKCQCKTGVRIAVEGKSESPFEKCHYELKMVGHSKHFPIVLQDLTRGRLYRKNKLFFLVAVQGL